MRNVKNGLIYALVVGSGAGQWIFGVERPASLDDEMPELKEIPRQAEGAPFEVEEKRVELKQAAVEVEGRPFLGVGSLTIDETLALHLGLEHGVVVKTVHPQSGAAIAGLQEHDILLEFEGEAIDSPTNLRDRIQDCVVGEEVTVGLVRKGQKEERVVTLGARPKGVPGIDAIQERNRGLGGLQQIWPQPGGDFGENAREEVKRLRDMIHEQLNAADIGLKLHEFFDGDLPDAEGKFDIDLNAQSSVTWADEHGDIAMRMRNGQTEVAVRDREGNLVYEGPWDTPQDKAAVDPEVRQRIEDMGVQNEGNRFRFFMDGPEVGPNGE
ncbi:MAG: PDZ domain-containing protein [Verrucomicrobiota bacterium]